MSNGFNPIRWKCEKDGCFNEKCRPKIEVFADCFPGAINFGDIDGIVEINYRCLLLEWKGNGADVKTAQRILYEHLSAQGHVILTVRGDAATMVVQQFGLYVGGKFSGWNDGGLDAVKDICTRWQKRAKELPPPTLRKAVKEEKFSRKDHDEWVADYTAHEHEFPAFRDLMP